MKHTVYVLILFGKYKGKVSVVEECAGGLTTVRIKHGLATYPAKYLKPVTKEKDPELFI